MSLIVTAWQMQRPSLYLNSGFVINTSGGTYFLNGELDLPDSAVITRVYAFWVDRAVNVPMRLDIIRSNYLTNPPNFAGQEGWPDDGGGIIAEVESRNNQLVASTSQISFPVVDRSTYNYYYHILMGSSGTDNVTIGNFLHGVRCLVIQYRMVGGQ